jgi:hypothetical protein
LPETIAVVGVTLPRVPVVTVAVVDAVTVNEAVAVVLVSVIVSVAAVEPQVRSAVAEVFEVTVGVPMLAPVPPLSVNNPAAVSDNQSVFVPVSVIVPWQAVVQPPLPGAPEFGEMETVAVWMLSEAVAESALSEMVEVPVPDPVVTTMVAAVVELTFWLTLVSPVSAESENTVVPLFHAVLLPARVSVIFPLWFAGIVLGDTVKLAPPAEYS